MGKRSKKSRKQKKQISEQKITHASEPIWQKRPNLVAVIIIFILLLIFFRDVMFANKTLLPPDTITSQSFQTFIRDALNRHIYPLWNPYIFCGMPSFASLSSAPYIDIVGRIIFGIIWIFKKVIPISDFTRILINYFLLGGLLFLYLRTKKLSTVVSLYSSIAFVFIPQIIAYTAFGHNTKLETAIFLPILLLLTEKLLERRNLLFFSLTGLCVGLQLLRAHIQIAFFTHLMIGIFLIYWMIQDYREEKNWKHLIQGIGLWAGAIVLGGLVSSVLNLSTWEYSHYSIRGGIASGLDYGYATNWSFPPSEMVTFLNPSFMGFGGQTYWGPMPWTDFPLYFGVITFLLAGLSILFNRNRTTWFFMILAIITLLISFGKHLPILYGPMFKIVPLFNKFRAPKMILVLFNLSMVILAAYGLHALIKFDKKDAAKSKLVQRYIAGLGGIIVLLLFILFIGKGTYLGWAQKIGANGLTAYNKATSDGLRILLFFILSGGAILLAIHGNLKMKYIPFILIALATIDLWTVDNRFVEPKDKIEQKNYFTETPEVRFLKEKNEPFRILQAGDQRTENWYMYHKIQNVFGYQAAKLKIYQNLLQRFDIPNGFIRKYIKTVDGKYAWKSVDEISDKQMQIDQAFLKLTNVKYIISPYVLPDTTLKPVFPPQQHGANGILQYKHALPRIYFPLINLHLEDDEIILRYMTNGKYDPARVAVIEEKPPFRTTYSDSNLAQITHYDIHHIQIEADIKTPSQMVLSEVYYPAGWKAYINGKETKIYKTNYAFRSIFLKPGKHQIEFIFKPSVFRMGLTMSIASFLLLIGGTVVGWQIERKKIKKEKETA